MYILSFFVGSVSQILFRWLGAAPRYIGQLVVQYRAHRCRAAFVLWFWGTTGVFGEFPVSHLGGVLVPGYNLVSITLQSIYPWPMSYLYILRVIYWYNFSHSFISISETTVILLQGTSCDNYVKISFTVSTLKLFSIC